MESVNNHLRSQGIMFSHDMQDLIADCLQSSFCLSVSMKWMPSSAGFKMIIYHFTQKREFRQYLQSLWTKPLLFGNNQAKFPPKLRLQEPLQVFPGSIKLPFTEWSQQPTSNGSYRQVFQVKVAEGYVDGCRPVRWYI